MPRFCTNCTLIVYAVVVCYWKGYRNRMSVFLCMATLRFVNARKSFISKTKKVAKRCTVQCIICHWAQCAKLLHTLVICAKTTYVHGGDLLQVYHQYILLKRLWSTRLNTDVTTAFLTGASKGRKMCSTLNSQIHTWHVRCSDLATVALYEQAWFPPALTIQASKYRHTVQDYLELQRNIVAKAVCYWQVHILMQIHMHSHQTS